MKRRRIMSTVVFTDLSLNALLSFLVLFVLAYIQMNPEKKKEDVLVETDGKFALVLRWPDASTDDVDLWVMDPEGNIVFYQGRDVGLMHLEHDDLGARSDEVRTKSGGEVKVEKNEERTILRGIIPGEYTVNVHMYSKETPAPTPVSVTLYKLQGDDVEILRKERPLAATGDEWTAFRFSLDAEGHVSGVNELPRSIVRKVGARPPGRFPWTP